MKKILFLSFRMCAAAFSAVAVSFILCGDLSRFVCSVMLCTILFAFAFGVFKENKTNE